MIHVLLPLKSAPSRNITSFGKVLPSCSTGWRCKHENDVTIDTISSDEIEEVLSCQTRYN